MGFQYDWRCKLRLFLARLLGRDVVVLGGSQYGVAAWRAIQGLSREPMWESHREVTEPDESTKRALRQHPPPRPRRAELGRRAEFGTQLPSRLPPSPPYHTHRPPKVTCREDRFTRDSNCGTSMALIDAHIFWRRLLRLHNSFTSDANWYGVDAISIPLEKTSEETSFNKS